MPVRSQRLPKYLQISQDIVDMIRRGELPVGHQTPSENEIISQYGVSNTTARKALQEIEQAGWVTRIKTRGTYVSSARVGRSVDKILSFTKNMIQAGRVPSTRLLRVRVRKLGQSIALQGRTCRLEGPVCVLERLRLADGIPMMKETRYISEDLCPGIEKMDLEGSLYQIYEEAYGLQLMEINQVLNVTMLEKKSDMDLFQIEDPTPAFLVTGATSCSKDVILEIEESLYRGDLYQFAIRASR